MLEWKELPKVLGQHTHEARFNGRVFRIGDLGYCLIVIEQRFRVGPNDPIIDNYPIAFRKTLRGAKDAVERYIVKGRKQK